MHRRLPWTLAVVSLAACQPAPDSLYEQILNADLPDVSATDDLAARRPQPPLGKVTQLSTGVPQFPESTLAAGAYVAVSGPASFDIALGQPAEITLHDRWSGAYKKKIQVPYPAYLPPGAAPNALSVAVPGALGDVYVAQVLTGVYRLNTLLGFGEVYTTTAIPDLPPCHLGGAGDCSMSTPCADPPTPGAPACTPDLGLPPLGNSLAFTDDGMLYESDSFQASVWRVDPATRSYALWLTSPQLEGNPYGPFPAGANGLAVGPDGYLYIANTTGGPTYGGAIYRVPLVDHPTEADIELVASYDTFQPPGVPFALPQGPDGLSFDATGHLWATLAFANAVVRITLDQGVAVAEDRFGHQPATGIPFNQPSEIHLDARQPLGFVANHALEPPTPADWALFSVATAATGAPLAKPWVGWTCGTQPCTLGGGFDAVHAAHLVLEELAGL